MANKKDELLDHDYDGIQEYDNDLPRWWLVLFWGGILFGFVYVGLYSIGGWKFTSQKLDSEMEKIEKVRELVKASEPDEGSRRDVLLQLVADEAALSVGQRLFKAKCAACHLEQGQGLVGPNLTDDYWLHGGDVVDIRHVIDVGVADKGMIAWGPLMKGDEIDQVAAYVWSLHGTSPPNPKAPQGDLHPRDEYVKSGE